MGRAQTTPILRRQERLTLVAAAPRCESNVMDLDPLVKDPYGMPVVRVTHHIGENERRGRAFLNEKLRLWLEAAGATTTWTPDDIRLESRHPFVGHGRP